MYLSYPYSFQNKNESIFLYENISKVKVVWGAASNPSFIKFYIGKNKNLVSVYRTSDNFYVTEYDEFEDEGDKKWMYIHLIDTYNPEKIFILRNR